MFSNDWRENGDYVETNNGGKYYVDSCHTYDNRYETIVRLLTNGLIPEPGAPYYIKEYNSYEEMMQGHYDICNNLEEWLKDRGNE